MDGAQQRRRHVPARRSSSSADFGYEAGGWRVEKHPRFLADITGDGRADIVGFGDAGVWTALSNGDGTFQAPQFVVADFGFNAGGWRVEKHPRFLADITGDGRADIVGFGDAGVYVALAHSGGAFPGPVRFVLPNFGYLLTVLAIARSDREIEDAGIWRSSDGGGTWSPVHSFPRPGGSPARCWAAGLGAGHGASRLRRRPEFPRRQPGRRSDLANCHAPSSPHHPALDPCAG